MMGKLVIFLVILFLVIVFSLYDFDNLLNKGEDRYIQRYSGMLSSCFCVMMIPPFAFGLKGDVGVFLIIIFEVIYITIYTWIYIKIRKIKEERKNS